MAAESQPAWAKIFMLRPSELGQVTPPLWASVSSPVRMISPQVLISTKYAMTQDLWEEPAKFELL